MTKSNELIYTTTIGKPIPLGVSKLQGGINFALIVSNKSDEKCSLILYKKKTLDVVTEILFTKEMKFGNVYAMSVMGISLNEYDYNYRIGNKITTDPYAVLVNGTAEFGHTDKACKTSGFYTDKFNWENDIHPCIPFSDSIIYRLHVRGFTKGKYSKINKKGTFLGILEKIDYLKMLGITMVELMPAYEFNEVIDMKEFTKDKRINVKNSEQKIDFWGYRDADYFMPKVSYSSKKDAKGAINEFKTLVKELHRNKIEVCMEFYFEKTISPSYILDCFRYWVINYHIDAIHCNLSDDIRSTISLDPYLASTKIISYGFDENADRKDKHLGECNDVFMNVIRKFIKGDEGQIKEMAFRIRYNKSKAQSVNYVANNNSFTLMDAVSFGSKHNLLNGELNMDGSDYNNSWNCGVEGKTKSKSVNKLRMQQIKNALCLLMLSQGTPMIYAGDEFGNSCNGNNNPYCQDNEVSYLDWRLINKNSELLEFFIMLVKFRKTHKILHMDRVLQVKDYYSLGMPDISFHSEKTWCLDDNDMCRHMGTMLFGAYTKLETKKIDDNIYIAMNMHWELKHLGLPSPGKNKKWKIIFTSLETTACFDELLMNKQRILQLPPRSIVVLVSE